MAMESRLGDVAVLVGRIIAARDQLIVQTLAGARRCDEALKELAALLDDLKILEAHVAEPHSHHTASAMGDVVAERRAGHSARLGVKETATLKEIKTAYRRLAKRCHPDIGGAIHAKEFHDITEAYRWLVEHSPD
jgi:hypothetical protein